MCGASRKPPTGDLACNPGMSPDWELNWRPFGSQPVLNPLSYISKGTIMFLLLYLYLLLDCPLTNEQSPDVDFFQWWQEIDTQCLFLFI